MEIPLSIDSEYGILACAIVGYPDNYYRLELKPMLIKEMNKLINILQLNGVRIFQPNPFPGAPNQVIDQLTPRDIGFVIGQKLFISSMCEKRRRDEWKGIEHFFPMLSGDIIHIPPDVCIEGGDIVIEGDVVYCGVSSRTTMAGISFLKGSLGNNYTVIPLPIKEIHLDLVFNIIDRGIALIHSPLFEFIPEGITNNYSLIEVGKTEYEMTAINSLSIGNKIILVRDTCRKTISSLRTFGFEVIEVEYNGVPQKGGGIRCSILPLNRL